MWLINLVILARLTSSMSPLCCSNTATLIVLVFLSSLTKMYATTPHRSPDERGGSDEGEEKGVEESGEDDEEEAEFECSED